jgi:hypothetical protein
VPVRALSLRTRAPPAARRRRRGGPRPVAPGTREDRAGRRRRVSGRTASAAWPYATAAYAARRSRAAGVERDAVDHARRHRQHDPVCLSSPPPAVTVVVRAPDRSVSPAREADRVTELAARASATRWLPRPRRARSGRMRRGRRGWPRSPGRPCGARHLEPRLHGPRARVQ